MIKACTHGRQGVSMNEVVCTGVGRVEIRMPGTNAWIVVCHAHGELARSKGAEERQLVVDNDA